MLETDYDRLIVNGDLVNNLNLKKLKPRHWNVMHHLREVARRRELILVRGNHDAAPVQATHFGPLQVLSSLLEVPLHEDYLLETSRGPYLVIHGDRFDPTLQWPLLTDTADWCYHAVQKVNKKAAKWLKKRVKRLGGVVRIVKDRAVQYARGRGCAGVITGHTHFSDNEWVDDIHYLNSGCWVELTGTYIKIEDDDIRLCHWSGAEVSSFAAPTREWIDERTNGQPAMTFASR